MYGYVLPVKSELTCGDFALYRSFYCGICKLTGKLYGQLPRFTTNYDMTFLSVLLHEYAKVEYRFENKGCVLNPLKKKVTVCSNPLFERIVAANIILSYHKANDGVLDKEGMKHRLLKRLLTRPYKKARAVLPGVDETCNTWYNQLRELEQKNCASPDRAADCFANLLKESVATVLDVSQNDTRVYMPNLQALIYNVGKFVYLADALDDVAEDFKKQRYNPFLARFPSFTTKVQLIEANRGELEFILATAVNRAIESFNNIQFEFENGAPLLRNILYKGLREKCTELFASAKKLKSPKL